MSTCKCHQLVAFFVVFTVDFIWVFNAWNEWVQKDNKQSERKNEAHDWKYSRVSFVWLWSRIQNKSLLFPWIYPVAFHSEFNAMKSIFGIR